MSPQRIASKLATFTPEIDQQHARSLVYPKTDSMQASSVRLNKFISESGLCSRREADRFIENGLVLINGRKAVVGDQVKVGDRVRVNGSELEPRKADNIVFIALNKPVGITSTTEDGVRDNIVQFVNHTSRIFPIGRLDKDSQGLIFLTNDGDMVNKILRAGNNHEKEYVVTVNKPLTAEAINGMAKGVPMLGVVTKRCKIVQEGAQVFRIILVQGLNRQIRRMCAHYGYEVTKLERVRIMNISLKGLPTGDWRDLTAQEMDEIYSLVEDSSSVVEAKSVKPKAAPKKARPAPGRPTHAKPVGLYATGPKPAAIRTSGGKGTAGKSGSAKPSGAWPAGVKAAGERTPGAKPAGARAAGGRPASGKPARPGAAAGGKYGKPAGRSNDSKRGPKGKSPRQSGRR